jgi:hypothetical protein
MEAGAGGGGDDLFQALSIYKQLHYVPLPAP